MVVVATALAMGTQARAEVCNPVCAFNSLSPGQAVTHIVDVPPGYVSAVVRGWGGGGGLSGPGPNLSDGGGGGAFVVSLTGLTAGQRLIVYLGPKITENNSRPGQAVYVSRENGPILALAAGGGSGATGAAGTRPGRGGAGGTRGQDGEDTFLGPQWATGGRGATRDAAGAGGVGSPFFCSGMAGHEFRPGSIAGGFGFNCGANAQGGDGWFGGGSGAMLNSGQVGSGAGAGSNYLAAGAPGSAYSGAWRIPGNAGDLDLTANLPPEGPCPDCGQGATQADSSIPRIGGRARVVVRFGEIYDPPPAPPVPDLNGDGKADIVWQDGSSNIWVWLMDGVTRIGGPVATSPAGFPGWSLEAEADFGSGPGDSTPDGKFDLVLRQQGSGQVAIWYMDGLNQTSGSLTTPSAVPDLRWRIVSAGDFGRSPTDPTPDGKPDLLWHHASSGEVVLWYMDGPVLTAGTIVDSLPDTGWRAVGTGDFGASAAALEPDGKRDILWQHQTSGQIVVWYMNGATRTSGAFTDPPALTDTSWKIAAIADYDGDGRNDLLFNHVASNQAVVWFMNGNVMTGGTFTTPDRETDLSRKVVGPR